MLFYNIPAFAEDDVNAFLSGVARSNSLVKKVRTFVCSLDRYTGSNTCFHREVFST